jgi:hypothetical protein
MGECESDSPTTTEDHRLFATTRCCNYSLFELVMMGECGSDSPTTTEGHRLFATTRCCNYSLFELLMMGECGSDSPTMTEGHRLFATTRCCNYSLFGAPVDGWIFHPKHVEPFTGNKILYKKVSSCWNIFKNWFTMHGQMSIKLIFICLLSVLYSPDTDSVAKQATLKFLCIRKWIPGL